MIERMEDFILTGMGIPFTPFTIVNGEKLVPLLDRIRENLPAEVQQAQRVLDRRDEIVIEAQAKANQILQDAKKQSEFMLSESELLRAVHEEANRIRQQITMELEAMRKKTFEEAEAARAQAYEEAMSVRGGADQYAEAILGSLDKSLVEFQAVVRNGQRHLKKVRMDAAQQMPPALAPSYGTYRQETNHQAAEEQGSSANAAYAQAFLKQTTLSNP
jgi:vacuolar-type H+-ATPase subunit H